MVKNHEKNDIKNVSSWNLFFISLVEILIRLDDRNFNLSLQANSIKFELGYSKKIEPAIFS